MSSVLDQHAFPPPLFPSSETLQRAYDTTARACITSIGISSFCRASTVVSLTRGLQAVSDVCALEMKAMKAASARLDVDDLSNPFSVRVTQTLVDAHCVLCVRVARVSLCHCGSFFRDVVYFVMKGALTLWVNPCSSLPVIPGVQRGKPV